MCFQQRFVSVLTAFRRFWYKYVCFDLNSRMVVVASIKMLLARRILDIACFRHYYYYSHLLYIIGICNPQETSCYAWPASVIKLQHWIEMLALPRQNSIMPHSGPLHRVRRFYDFCLNIGCFAIEKRVKQKFSPWILLPVITKYVRPYFQLLVDKGLI